MKELIIKIMVEILGILAIATKAIKQRWTSKLSHYAQVTVDRSLAEKYLMKLIGRRDVEDALMKLEKLSSDEALMATAQVLKLTHDVDNKVVDVEEKVTGIDHRIIEVSDGAQHVF